MAGPLGRGWDSGDVSYGQTPALVTQPFPRSQQGKTMTTGQDYRGRGRFQNRTVRVFETRWVDSEHYCFSQLAVWPCTSRSLFELAVPWSCAEQPGDPVGPHNGDSEAFTITSYPPVGRHDRTNQVCSRWESLREHRALSPLYDLLKVTRPCSELGHKDLSEWSQRYKHADRQGECERGLQINRNLKKNTNKQTDKREMVRNRLFRKAYRPGMNRPQCRKSSGPQRFTMLSYITMPGPDTKGKPNLKEITQRTNSWLFSGHRAILELQSHKQSHVKGLAEPACRTPRSTLGPARRWPAQRTTAKES
ncbi:hypothetical protein RRG08_025618 [Elysia crispata]|uniref:Uncharacterized protein n=1 Tax=Elysia crispata TaxID=231223 RepID=A0AAE1CXA9_9GAST|nr:hypothetical protein RRG08_025618 [Elysia crispata]